MQMKVKIEFKNGKTETGDELISFENSFTMVKISYKKNGSFFNISPQRKELKSISIDFNE